MEQQQFPPPGQHDPITEIFPAPGRQQNPTNQNDHVPPPSPLQSNQQITPPSDHRINLVKQNDNIVPDKQHMPYNYPQSGQPMPQHNNGYQPPQMGDPSKIHPQMFPPQYSQGPRPQMPYPGPFYHQPIPSQYPVAPPPMPPVPMTLQPWTTGLFDCAQDMENTIITLFCPCITFGQVADIVDQGMTTCSSAAIMYWLIFSFSGLQWIYSWMYRTRLRAQYALPEDPFHDCLVHFLCEYCALCQEYRELKNRGFNMELGYIGNMAQLQAAAAAQLAPPPAQGMAR